MADAVGQGHAVHLHHHHPAGVPPVAGDRPYNVVQVAPDEAPNVHMVSNVVDVDNADLKIGMPLEIVYDDVTPEDTIFRWKPA